MPREESSQPILNVVNRAGLGRGAVVPGQRGLRVQLRELISRTDDIRTQT